MLCPSLKEGFRGTAPAPLWVSPVRVPDSISYDNDTLGGIQKKNKYDKIQTPKIQQDTNTLCSLITQHHIITFHKFSH